MARRFFRVHALLLAGLAASLGGCSTGTSPSTGPAPSSPPPTMTTFTITSPEFASGKPVPRPYTCDGGDRSPPLRWSEPPTGTRSLTLIVDDPDAPGGTWVHWVLYNLPVTTRSLPEAVAVDANGPDGSRQGRNSFGRLGYGGPCPPAGSTHHYFFRLYALDIDANVPAEATAGQLQSAMDKHILAYAELVGTYTK
jgi:Raf kinase inhibitor-like YbhB/YbcL family protein